MLVPILTLELTPNSLSGTATRVVRARAVRHTSLSEAVLWETVCNPERAIDHLTSQIVGVSNTDATSLPLFKEVLGDLLDFAEGCSWVLVDSNTQGLLKRELRTAKIKADSPMTCLPEILGDDETVKTVANKNFVDVSQNKNLLIHQVASLSSPENPSPTGFVGEVPVVDFKGEVTPLDMGSMFPQPERSATRMPSLRPPTEEQFVALEAAAAGDSVTVEAMAGTGKTTLLEMMSLDSKTPSLYLAFNSRIVEEAEVRFPEHVTPSTIHSHAYRHSPPWVKGKIAAGRGLYPNHALDVMDTADKASYPGGLTHREMAVVALQALEGFCRSADEIPASYHCPTPKSLQSQPVVAREVKEIAAPIAAKLWGRITTQSSGYPLEHGHYLKMWALTAPKFSMRYERILFDEAQDANDLMVRVLQDHADRQIVLVGDSAQQVYEWNGAINSMARLTTGESFSLTHSFRFGPEIAEIANGILSELMHPSKVAGVGAEGEVSEYAQLVPEAINTDAVLARTNSGLLDLAFQLHESNRKFSIVGGLDELEGLSREASRLMAGKAATHPDLIGFRSWEEVEEWSGEADADPSISRFVALVKRRGIEPVRALAKANSGGRQSQGGLTLSTVHRAKGREWDRVMVMNDFPQQLSAEELRIRYVAVTRARRGLSLPRSWSATRPS